jgi:hypothetical protein
MARVLEGLSGQDEMSMGTKDQKSVSCVPASKRDAARSTYTSACKSFMANSLVNVLSFLYLDCPNVNFICSNVAVGSFPTLGGGKCSTLSNAALEGAFFPCTTEDAFCLPLLLEDDDDDDVGGGGKSNKEGGAFLDDADVAVFRDKASAAEYRTTRVGPPPLPPRDGKLPCAKSDVRFRMGMEEFAEDVKKGLVVVEREAGATKADAAHDGVAYKDALACCWWSALAMAAVCMAENWLLTAAVLLLVCRRGCVAVTMVRLWGAALGKEGNAS